MTDTTPMPVAIVTGGNSGLGVACARALLRAAPGAPAWNVILACRDAARGREAASLLNGEAEAAGSPGRAGFVPLDLGSLASIRAFAVDIARRRGDGTLAPVRAIVCNAGVQSGATTTYTSDGFERTFGVNHLGHFLLVQLLRPQLTPPYRIAVVASGVHDPAQRTGIPEPAWNAAAALARGELGPTAAADAPATAGRRRYATSKLANVYFAYELARRLPPGSTVNAFDPGLMPGTGLAREAPAPVRWLWERVLPRALPLARRFILANAHSPAASGLALARLVRDPALAGITGRYFEGMTEIRSSQASYDAGVAADLWTASEVLTTTRA